MSKILLYQEATSGVTTGLSQHAFFINENGIPTVKNGSQVIQFSTSGYAFAGSSGSSGMNGTNGFSGTSGISGTSGQDGAPGDIGPAGSSGSSGMSGTSGINGIDGATGISGTSGVDGTFFGSSGSSGANGSAGVGVPVGGSTGQVLAKASATDYDTQWVDQSGGGGSSPYAFTKSMLAPVSRSSATPSGSWRTWVQTTSFSRSSQPISTTSAMYAIFSAAPNTVINQIQFFVPTAVSGGLVRIGIYRVGYDAATNTTILTDLLVDCGTVSTTTSGAKTITLASPYTVGQETYGSIAIVAGGSTAINLSAWSASVWDGNGGLDVANDGTFYRSIGLFVNSNYASSLPSSLSTATYGSATGDAFYVLIR